ncbi:hypothetical protein RS75_21950 [Rhizobium nepotum 39/7]|uniref:Uncharacterized protein n=2 Tax=Rhizobium/Agrobacterium group TaxID=227290 RepID=A0ABR5CL97_9HYPH|nr:hypothetical protein RS75_21950 [Rhizobium nepotum 39/7]KJF70945.1 hypothetical protein RP75_23505 [Agrobacterium arsenijevicii]
MSGGIVFPRGCDGLNVFLFWRERGILGNATTQAIAFGVLQLAGCVVAFCPLAALSLRIPAAMGVYDIVVRFRATAGRSGVGFVLRRIIRRFDACACGRGTCGGGSVGLERLMHVIMMTGMRAAIAACGDVRS